MADSFKTRTTALIDSIPSRITDNDLDQWVRDGLTDVVRRAINKDPLKAELFAKSNLTSSSQGVDSRYGVVISATLNNVSCDEVSYKMKAQIQDPNSVHYRTAANPCYYREAGKVVVFPYAAVPQAENITGASSVYGGLGTKFILNNHGYAEGTALYMTGMTTDESGDADPFTNVSIIISDVTTNNFVVMIPFPDSTIGTYGSVYGFEANIIMPVEPTGNLTSANTALENCDIHHESLVVLYMAQRCMFSGMSSISLDAIPMDVLPTQPSPPESPDYTDIESITFENSSMIFQEGTAGTTGADIPTTSSGVISGDNWSSMLDAVGSPTYSGPVVFPDYSAANDFLDDEDVELVQAKLNIIQTELQEYQGSIQEALNKFNKENVVYQSKVKATMDWYRAIGTKRVDSKPFSATSDRKAEVSVQANSKEAELKFQKEVQEYTSKLGKYQAEIGSWQQEVGKVLQEYSAKIQANNTDYQWYTGKYSMLRKEYLEGF